MEIVDNPTFEVVAPEVDKAAFTDIETAFRNGTLTAEQGVVQMHKQLDAKSAEIDEKLAALEAKLAAAAAPLASAVRSVFAHLSEAPTNWHQGTIHFANTTAPEDAAMRAKAPLFLLGSMMIVLGQCVVATGVLHGTFEPSCSTSDQCRLGSFCEISENHRCKFCGKECPLPEQVNADGTTLNNYRADRFVGYNLTAVKEVCADPSAVADEYAFSVNSRGTPYTERMATTISWCETCVHSVDGTVNPTTEESFIANNVAGMGPFDWVALVFASFVVALTVAGELRDVLLCDFAIRQADGMSSSWRFALQLLGVIRRWLFLPGMIFTVPILVYYEGGDALSVCFNTIAILFLCEVDNAAYAMGLGDRVRARVEHVGRVELGGLEAAALVRTKVAHIGAITMYGLGMVWLQNRMLGVALAYVPFWIGGVAEALVVTSGGADTAKRVCKVTGAALLGPVVLLMLLASAALANR
jgi:hypothetical protein